MKVFIHPNALLQISDHYTRSKYSEKEIPFICGVIYGNQERSTIDMTTTIEVITQDSDEGLIIDPETFEPQHQHHLKIYPEEIPIAWYSSKKLNENEIQKLGNAFKKLLNNVYARIEFNIEDENHPISVYLPQEDGSWVQSDYSYRSEAPERISVIHLQSDGKAENRIGFTKTAFEELRNNIEIIMKYLEDVQSGKQEFNCQLVRDCATIAKWWKHSHMKKTPRQAFVSGQFSYLAGLLAQTMVELEKNYQASAKK